MPFGNEIYLFNYSGSCTFRIYMVMGVYLQNNRNGYLLFPTPSGGRRPLEMKYTFSITLGHVLSEYIWLWGSISKSPGVVACFSLHLQERDAPWKSNILVLVPWVMYFQNIYGYGVYLQSPRKGCLLFPAPSGGRCPLEMKHTYPDTLGHVLSKYIWS